jgi:pyrroline-5-carboxylate reductase
MIGSIGILGVGHLAGYLVEGFRRSGDELSIVLSSRNAEHSQRLAERFGARRAGDNRDLVSQSDAVILATRPAQCVEAVRGLPWKTDHVIVSVAAGVSLEELEAVCRPATVVRAMPVSCAAIGESPTTIFPEHEMVRALFERLGPVFAMPDEPSFESASVVGALYAWIYALLDETTGWMLGAGVPASAARNLVAQATRGATGMVLARPDQTIEDMLESLATSGGLTEKGLEVLRESNALAAWSHACDAALKKIREGQR